MSKSKYFPTAHTSAGNIESFKHWGLSEPYVRYDSRNHNHGPGYIYPPGPTESYDNTTGSLVNEGTAGSDWDMSVAQESVYVAASGSIPAYRRYTAYGSKAYPAATVLTKADIFGGSFADNGPMCFISVLGLLETDTALGFPGEGIAASSHSCEVYFEFEWSTGTWGTTHNHRLLGLYDSALYGYKTQFEDQSYSGYPNAAGGIVSDVNTRFKFDIELPPSMANKIIVTLMHVPSGLTDNWFNGFWNSDDKFHGYTPSPTKSFTQEWNGLNLNATMATSNRKSNIPGYLYPTEEVADPWFVRSKQRYAAVNIGGFRKFDSMPVVGAPWSFWRGMEFRRGVPTLDELATIATSFGVTL